MERDVFDEIEEQWQSRHGMRECSAMRITARIKRLAEQIERECEIVFAEHNLTAQNFEVLAALLRVGEPYQSKPTEIADALRLTSGAITNRLDRLETDRLIKRRTDSHDRRAVIVSLTKKGLEIVNQVIVEHFRNEERIVSALGEKERERLAGLLRKLNNSLEIPTGTKKI